VAPRFESFHHAIRAIANWISFCNRRRPHQALDVKAPAEGFAPVAETVQIPLGRYDSSKPARALT
jgi:putative transposase